MIKLSSEQNIGREEISKLIYSAQQLEQQATQYQKQLDILNNYVKDITNAEQVINQMKNLGESKKILVPIGAGNFINAIIEKTDTIISSVGAGVHIETAIDDVLSDLSKRKLDINNQISQVQASYNQVVERLHEIDKLVKSV